MVRVHLSQLPQKRVKLGKPFCLGLDRCQVPPWIWFVRLPDFQAPHQRPESVKRGVPEPVTFGVDFSEELDNVRQLFGEGDVQDRVDADACVLSLGPVCEGFEGLASYVVVHCVSDCRICGCRGSCGGGLVVLIIAAAWLAL